MISKFVGSYCVYRKSAIGQRPRNEPRDIMSNATALNYALYQTLFLKNTIFENHINTVIYGAVPR